jgi:murein DD-endopeptidase MepM/ murein hydrolase activator NlpD
MTAVRRRKRRKKRLDAGAGKQGSGRLALVLAVLVGVNLYVFLWRGGTSIPDVMEKAAVAGQTELGARGMAGLRPQLSEADEEESLEEPGITVVDSEIAPGGSIDLVLRDAGLSSARAHEVIKALEPHVDFRAIRAGQRYRLELDPEGSFVSFEFEVSRVERVVAKASEPGGEITAEKLVTETEVRVEEVGGTIENSLYLSIRRAGEDTRLVSFFVDVFAYDLNFYVDTHPGDTFRMIIEKEYLDGEFYRYGDALAAEYSGLRGTFRAFRWKRPGSDEYAYYDEDGRPLERSLLRTPLKYTRISSRFNPNRMHPILHKRRGHMGTDYAAPTGTPIWAAGSGRITRRGWGGGGAGNMVVIQHDDGLQTRYMHLSRFADGQRVGQRVSQKTVIGYVGATGMATGPHLHFEVIQNGRHVNPEQLKLERADPLSDELKAVYLADVGHLVPQLAKVPVRGPWERVGRTIGSLVAVGE